MRLVAVGEKSAADVARLFGVHPATVSRLLQARAGNLKAAQPGFTFRCALNPVLTPSGEPRSQGDHELLTVLAGEPNRVSGLGAGRPRRGSSPMRRRSRSMTGGSAASPRTGVARFGGRCFCRGPGA